MKTPYAYTASAYTTVPRRLHENIPVFAFSGGDNHYTWDSFDIESDGALTDLKKDVDSCGWLTLAVPLPEHYQTFTSSAQFELLRLFANRDHEDQYNVSCMIDLRTLTVRAHGKLQYMPVDDYLERRFVHEGKDPKWMMPHWILLSVNS